MVLNKLDLHFNTWYWSLRSAHGSCIIAHVDMTGSMGHRNGIRCHYGISPICSLWILTKSTYQASHTNMLRIGGCVLHHFLSVGFSTEHPMSNLQSLEIDCLIIFLSTWIHSYRQYVNFNFDMNYPNYHKSLDILSPYGNTYQWLRSVGCRFSRSTNGYISLYAGVNCIYTFANRYSFIAVCRIWTLNNLTESICLCILII